MGAIKENRGRLVCPESNTAMSSGRPGFADEYWLRVRSAKASRDEAEFCWEQSMGLRFDESCQFPPDTPPRTASAFPAPELGPFALAAGRQGLGRLFGEVGRLGVAASRGIHRLRRTTILAKSHAALFDAPRFTTRSISGRQSNAARAEYNRSAALVTFRGP
jgi:hypothetical protein